MQNFTRTQINNVLEITAVNLEASAHARHVLRHRKTADRRKRLASCRRSLAFSGRHLRPLRHALVYQEMHRADDIRAASIALQKERRLIRKMLARTR